MYASQERDAKGAGWFFQPSSYLRFIMRLPDLDFLLTFFFFFGGWGSISVWVF